MHYTAWLTTSWDCLATDYCDVVVMRDEVCGYRDDENGNEIPEYTCAGGDPVFQAVLSVRYDAEDLNDVIFDEADRLLRDAGWRVEYPDFRTDYPDTTWQPVTTGCLATVTRIDGEE